MSFFRIRRLSAATPRCPYCHARLRREAHAPRLAFVTCGECSTPHHAGCFAEHGRCTALGCASETVRWGPALLDADALHAASQPAARERPAPECITVAALVLTLMFQLACVAILPAVPMVGHTHIRATDDSMDFAFRFSPPRIDDARREPAASEPLSDERDEPRIAPEPSDELELTGSERYEPRPDAEESSPEWSEILRWHREKLLRVFCNNNSPTGIV